MYTLNRVSVFFEKQNNLRKSSEKVEKSNSSHNLT